MRKYIEDKENKFLCKTCTKWNSNSGCTIRDSIDDKRRKYYDHGVSQYVVKCYKYKEDWINKLRYG